MRTAKNKNRSGRYKPKIEKANLADQIEIEDIDRNSIYDSENIFVYNFSFVFHNTDRSHTLQ